MMKERDDLRKQDPASPRLSTMNDEITKATSDHKRRQWREFVESIDHRTDSTKLWRTIKGIEGKSRQTSENEGITFTGTPHTSPKRIANSFNHQFTTSKLGKHSSSRRTRHVSKDVKRMSLEEAETVTSDQVTSAIKSCRSSRAYGPDSLSIFHLKNLGPLATEHLTALYNAPHTRLTCHQRIYGGIRWDQFVHLATSTTETLTDLTTDLVMANNNNSVHSIHLYRRKQSPYPRLKPLLFVRCICLLVRI